MIDDHSPDDLTLHQKASLGSGASFWRTKTVAGLPAAALADGPHGVRAQVGADDHLGIARAPRLPVSRRLPGWPRVGIRNSSSGWAPPWPTRPARTVPACC